MKKILIPILLLVSMFAHGQAFTGRTANNALFMRYTDTTGVAPVIGNNTVALLWRTADSTLYWWTNIRKTWTKFTAANPTLQQVITAGATMTGNNTITLGAFILTFSGTGAIILPSGTTAQRPSSPTAFMTRFNTDSSGAAALEYYSPVTSGWVNFNTSGGGGGGSPGGSSGSIQYNSSGSFGGNSNFLWNNSANGVKIISSSLGTTQADASGLYLQNGTAAATGAQQISPSMTWEGQGWKTTATAASEPVNYTAYVTPVQGAANPTGYWSLYGKVNGGSYIEGLRVNAPGVLGQVTLFPNTAASGGLSLIFGSGSSNAINFGGRTDFIINGFYMSTRGSNWTFNAGSAADPVSGYTSILAPVSTTAAQVGGWYNTTNYFTLQANSTGVTNLNLIGSAPGLTITPSTAIPAGTTTDSVLVVTTVSNVATVKKVSQSSLGGSSFYQTVQANASSQTQRPRLNFKPEFSVTDNGGNTSSDIGLLSIPSATTATTQSPGDNSTKVATTAYVDALHAVSGTYVPTLTNSVNIASSSLLNAYYTRVGNIVHVMISANYTPTAASTITHLTFSLPINYVTSQQQEIGVSTIMGPVASITTYTSGMVYTATNSTAFVEFTSLSTSAGFITVSFDYTL